MSDLVIAAADVSRVDGATKILTWGEAITQGQLVYPGTDGKYFRTDADETAKLGSSASMGIALTPGAAAQEGIVLLGPSKVRLGNVLIKGRMYYASPTPGAICLETDLAGSVNEVQQITSSGATSGTLTITFDGQTTAAIAFDATAAAIKAALEALSNIDLVSASGGPINSAAVDIEFQGVNAAKPLPQMTLDTTGLVGGANGVATLTEGVTGSFLAIVGYAENATDLKLLFLPTGIRR